MTDGLESLVRRLHYRGEQLTQVARRLRQTSNQPVFVAPAGDRSHVFVEAQARRLDRLAQRYRELEIRLGRLSGTLRPMAAEHLLIDWLAADTVVSEVIVCCPPPDRPEWEMVTADDDPEITTRPATGNGFRPRPEFLTPLGRTWTLDVDGIRRMTRQLRTMAAQIDGIGAACRREFRAPDGGLPAPLRAAIERAGLSTYRVCSDMHRRLTRHATAIDHKMTTPGLFGPGPHYGLSAFGMPPNTVPFDYTIDPAFTALITAGDEWHDRALELAAILEWLCRRLPVLFGTPAEAFLRLVGITDLSRPPDRPPGTLPPARYPPPADLADPTATIVDPATSVSMTQDEYYRRYGVPFGSPLPQPLDPLPVDLLPVGSAPRSDSAPHSDSAPQSDSTVQSDSTLQSGSTLQAGSVSQAGSTSQSGSGSQAGSGISSDSDGDSGSEPDTGSGAVSGSALGVGAVAGAGVVAGTAALAGIASAAGHRAKPQKSRPTDDASTDWTSNDTAAGDTASVDPTSTADAASALDSPSTMPTAWSSGDSATVEEPLASQTTSSQMAEDASVESVRSAETTGGNYEHDDGDGAVAAQYESIPSDSTSGADSILASDVASGGTAGAPTSAASGEVVPPGSIDAQLAADSANAVRRGGVRVTPGAGAALGSVIVGGASGGVAITKRNAAKKITSWAKYKALKHITGDRKADE